MQQTCHPPGHDIGQLSTRLRMRICAGRKCYRPDCVDMILDLILSHRHICHDTFYRLPSKIYDRRGKFSIRLSIAAASIPSEQAIKSGKRPCIAKFRVVGEELAGMADMSISDPRMS